MRESGWWADEGAAFDPVIASRMGCVTMRPFRGDL